MNTAECVDVVCADDMHLAERELRAFVNAVTETFGEEQGRVAADDWLEELELRDSPPHSTWLAWRAVTAAASARSRGG